MGISNYELGPAKVEFKGNDLGKTTGGITVTLEETFADLNTDQDGETPVDQHQTGTTCTVEGSLAEITLDNLAKVYKTTNNSGRVDIGTGVGTSMYNEAGELVLKPYDGGTVSGDPQDYFTVLHAGMKASGSLAYNATDQRGLGFTVTGYPDTATGRIATFGDTSA